jgi:hypothetical protein
MLATTNEDVRSFIDYHSYTYRRHVQFIDGTNGPFSALQIVYKLFKKPWVPSSYHNMHHPFTDEIDFISREPYCFFNLENHIVYV